MFTVQSLLTTEHTVWEGDTLCLPLLTCVPSLLTTEHTLLTCGPSLLTTEHTVGVGESWCIPLLICLVSVDDWTHNMSMMLVSLDMCSLFSLYWRLNAQYTRGGNLVLASPDMCLVSPDMCSVSIFDWTHNVKVRETWFSSHLTCIQSLMTTKYKILGWCSSHLTCVQSLLITEYTKLGWFSSSANMCSVSFDDWTQVLEGEVDRPRFSWHVSSLNFCKANSYTKTQTIVFHFLTKMHLKIMREWDGDFCDELRI